MSNNPTALPQEPITDLPTTQQVVDTSNSKPSIHSPIEISTQEESKGEELLFEYGELRKEILQNDALILQLMSVILTIVGLLMSFAITQVDDAFTQSIIFLVCCVISCFGIYHNTDRMKNTQRIGSYIRTFVEPELRYTKWEVRLAKYRKYRKPSRLSVVEYFKFMTDQRFIYTTIIVINTFLGLYTLSLATLTPNTSTLATPAAQLLVQAPIETFFTFVALYTSTILISFFLTLSTRNKKYVTSFDELWSRVRNEEIVSREDKH